MPRFLARLLGFRSAGADPYGPYRELLDADPHAYVRLLMPGEDEAELVGRIGELVRSRAGRRYVARFLEQADWRPHVFAAMAVPLAPRPGRFVGALWSAFDQGSWVSPQLAGCLYHVDARFAEEAWRRVRTLCPVELHPELASPEERAESPTHGPASEKNLGALLGLLEGLAGWGDRVRRERDAPDVRAMLEAERTEADGRAVGYAARLSEALEHLGRRSIAVRPADRFRRGRDPALALFRELTSQGIQRLRPGVHEDEFAVGVVTVREGSIELVTHPTEWEEEEEEEEEEEDDDDDLRRYRAVWFGPRPDRPRAWPEGVPFIPGIECRIDDPSGPHALEAIWETQVAGRAELRNRLMDLQTFDGPQDFLETVDELLGTLAPSVGDGEAVALVRRLAEALAGGVAEGPPVDANDPAFSGLWEAFHGAPFQSDVKRSLWDEVRRILAGRESEGWTILELRQDAGPRSYLLKIELGREAEREHFMVVLSCGHASFINASPPGAARQIDTGRS